MSLADIQLIVADLVRDKDQVLSSISIDQAIATAVQRYSGDAPRPLLADQVAVAGSLQPLPSGWMADVSVLTSVEYPVDVSPEAMLDSADYRIRHTPSGDRLQLSFDLLADEPIRVGYTADHVVDTNTDTVPLKHRHAVSCLAAANLCGQLASYYATEGMPSIGADVADHIGKTERFRARKRDLEAEYIRALGVPEKPVTAAAGTVAQLKSTDSQGNRRLFHGNRYPRRCD